MNKRRKLEIRKRRNEKKKRQSKIKPFSFFDSKHQYVSSKKTFGLCDDTPLIAPKDYIPQPAYLDETDGSKWIAVVANDAQINVKFVALDYCIRLLKSNGITQDRCSDGMLTYDSTIIFVELTTATHNNWKKDKDAQLRITIDHFEKTIDADNYQIKKAYIANSNHRVSSTSYQQRMDTFLNDTGYDLKIQNRIEIE